MSPARQHALPRQQDNRSPHKLVEPQQRAPTLERNLQSVFLCLAGALSFVFGFRNIELITNCKFHASHGVEASVGDITLTTIDCEAALARRVEHIVE